MTTATLKKKSEVKLKPCPFCGGKAKLKDFSAEGRYVDYRIVCTVCPVKMEGWGQANKLTREAAVIAWNRRTPEVE